MKSFLCFLLFSFYLSISSYGQQAECAQTPPVYDQGSVSLPCGQTGDVIVVVTVGDPPNDVSFGTSPQSADCYIMPSGWSFIRAQYKESTTFLGKNVSRYNVTFRTNSPNAGGEYQIRNQSTCILTNGTPVYYYSAYETGYITRPTPQLSVTGPELACIGGSSTYSIIGSVPSGASIDWTTAGSLAVNGANGGSQISIAGTSNGSFGDVILNLNSSCGVQQFRKNGIRSGTLPSANVTIQGVSPYGSVDVQADPGIATAYNWYRDNNFLQTSYSPIQTLNGGSCGQQHYMQVSLSNDCGTNSLSDPVYYNVNCSFAKAYPNPASDKMSVEFESASAQEDFPDEIMLISEDSNSTVYSANVQESYKSKKLVDGNKIEINSSRFKRGTYYLKITNQRNKENPVQRIRVILN